jgi:beta-glucanase (GH16 family)
MKNIFLIFILFCGFQSEAQNWNLVWSDEFDSVNINRKNWTYDIGGGGWGNNELEYYTNRPVNSTIENGNLLIIAKKESYGGNSYTSARLKTQGLQSFTYGKIESRMKLPLQQGIWPAFWMLGNSISQVGWPKCGEIDIMEHISKSTDLVGTLHWDNNGHVQSGNSIRCNVTQYHVYGVEWDAKSVRWYLDGKKYHEVSILNNINSTSEMHLPFFIILNLAVGGQWPGNPDGTTAFPDTMTVDYVRVYQLSTNTDVPDFDKDKFGLNQNYPNPFDQNTTISYNLPSDSFVSLKMFDFTGKKVATLVSGEMQSGNHSLNWDASNLPDGIYFCRLEAGSLTDTKKLILKK